MKHPNSSNLFTIILCFIVLFSGINSCKKGGGVTDPGEPPAETPEISSSFETEDPKFLPGEIRMIHVEGLTLKAGEYSAELGNSTPVILQANPADEGNATLLFVVPEESPGDHNLRFSLDGQEQSLAFSIREYEPIAEPEAFTNEFIEGLTIEFQQLIDETGDGAFKDRLVATMDTLKGKKAEISSLSEQEMKLLARIIATHFITENTSGKARIAALNCSDDLPKKALSSAVGAGVSLYALSLSGTVAATGWGIVVGGITGVISGTALYISLKSLKSNLITFWDCKTEYFDRALSALAEQRPLKQKGDVLAFEHGTAQSFYVVTEFEMPEGMQSALDKVKQYMDKAIELIPKSWADVIYRDYITEDIETPSNMELKNISEATIDGEVNITDSLISLKFEYPQGEMSTEVKDFTFELTDDGIFPGFTLSVSAELFPALPVAYDMNNIARTNSTLTDTLKADFAMIYSIESSPAHGSLTLTDQNKGIFQYVPGQDFSGNDSFTFAASNSSGKSNISTYDIKVTEGEPPVITDLVKSCTEDGEHIRLEVSFTDLDGPGFDPGGSYFGGPTEDGYSYPVRLYFQTQADGEWQHASNGYDASLKSGSINEGVIEVIIYLEGSSYTACRQSEYYNSEPTKWWHNWKLFLREPTDGDSNAIEFEVVYYGHVFGKIK